MKEGRRLIKQKEVKKAQNNQILILILHHHLRLHLRLFLHYCLHLLNKHNNRIRSRVIQAKEILRNRLKHIHPLNLPHHNTKTDQNSQVQVLVYKEEDCYQSIFNILIHYCNISIILLLYYSNID